MEDREAYAKFWKAFGLQIKYGVVADFGMRKDQLEELLVFENSFDDGLMSLASYAEKMPEAQKKIYCASAENAQRAAALPQTEQVRDAGFGLLYLTDDVDQFVIQMLDSYNDKKFCNVSSDDLGLETDLQKSDTEKLAEENKELLDFVKETLGDEVVAVRLSHKLKTHPVCLTTEGDITLEVERYFRSLPRANSENIRAQKVLELNGGHPAFAALQKAFGEDRERAAALSKILLAQAKLIADLPLDDPSAYAELVCGLF